MATVKVVNEFYDRYTKELHHAGDTFEADDNRIAEINSVSKHLIEVVPEVVEVAEPVKKTRSRKKAGDN